MLILMMISETKLDNTFPNEWFLIDRFHELVRLDINKNVGSILLIVREDIPTKVLPFQTSPVE